MQPGAEASALKRELAAKLSGLRDEERDRVAIRQAWPSESLYTGPYLDAAPDLIVGFADGYRASWDAAVGKVTGAVFSDNLQGLERRSLRRSAPGPGCDLLQPQDSARKTRASKTWRPRRSISSASQPPPYMEGKSCLEARQADAWNARWRLETTRWLRSWPRCCARRVLARKPRRPPGKRMIVLGIDGMDPVFLEAHWSSLPNLNRLRSQGDFQPARHHRAAAESGGLVHRDHRHGPGRPRHLRFRPPQSARRACRCPRWPKSPSRRAR